MGKRKHRDDRSRSGIARSGVGETLRHAKKPRLSPEATASGDMNGRRRIGEQDDEGWQTILPKGHRQKRNKQADVHDEKQDDRPRVYFDPRSDSQTSVRLGDLRDLALYVLADGTAPSWVAVRKARGIRKVVSVMVPGMDHTMLKRYEQLCKNSNGQGAGSNPSLTAPPQVNEPDGFMSDVPEKILDVDQDLQAANVSAGDKPEDLSWLLDGHFDVKAPGDTRQSRVHSPLQAMIMKGPDSSAQNRSADKNLERAFKAVRTPIADFIHTADELRDAEYPLHPVLVMRGPENEGDMLQQQAAQQSSTANGWCNSNVGTASPVLRPAATDTSLGFITQGLDVYAVDCEMVMTSDEKSSLARISVVSWPDGAVVLDKFVKPDLPIINYFTQYSGITELILENVTTKLSDIQQEMQKILNSSTVLLGHSLESDLNAMKMTHPFIIDTSMIYPHPRGLPLRSSLKFLSNKYLKREIQKGGANGHDSVEDARAVLDLVKLKCEKGPAWGTNEALGETIFSKLARMTKSNNRMSDGAARQTAIVEYGTPERGFGKDATFAIGCQNDDEIVKGILHCANGPETEGSDTIENGGSVVKGGAIPRGGVDFTWARLRGLEYARGWVTSNTSNINASIDSKGDANGSSNNDSNDGSNNNIPTKSTPTQETDTALLNLSKHLNALHNQLPQDTLLIICSGTSDMTRVTHYQSQQTRYRNEFKVKKWNELTVKWTDVEEQALREAVENARKGWGWIGVL